MVVVGVAEVDLRVPDRVPGWRRRRL